MEIFLEGGGHAFWGTSTPGDLIALTVLNPIVTSVTSTSISTTTTTATSVSTTTATSGGADTTTIYGLAAVAVIFIIATGYLAMRGRKPAS
jgi:hypothetical protein